jgi:3',5'-cyclic AMP phosphodiesterase CpdA
MKRIAYITDMHLHEGFPEDHGVYPAKNWELILADVRKKKFDEIIIGGDIGEHAVYPKFFKSLKDFTISVTPGNHDDPVEMSKYYFNHQQFSSIYSAREDAYLKYIFLDSSKARLGESQFHWFMKELKTQKKILIFIHHPILAVNTPVDKKYPLYGRDNIASLLYSISNEVIIFCGHYHLPDEKIIKNIKQFVTPAASFQVVKEAPTLQIHNRHFGYRIITVDNENISTEILLYTNGNFVSATDVSAFLS